MATLAREDEGSRIALAKEPPFRIGDLHVAPALRQVGSRGYGRTLEPRVMQVLVALAQAGGDIVGRDALIERCWDGRIVGENAINRVISLLRQLAAETEAFEIQTVTKVGYRLRPLQTSPEPRFAEPALPMSAAIGRRAAVAAIGGVAMGGCTYLLWSRQGGRGRSEAESYYRAGIESDRRGDSSTRQAIAYYEQAVRADPRHAAAWGALSRALIASTNGVDEARIEPLMQRARDASARALRLDPRNSDALTARVVAEPWFRNWAAAEAIARQALEIRPELNIARVKLALSLANTGRLAESLALTRAAVAREPLMPLHQTRLAWLLWQNGRPGDARRVFDRAYAVWPDNIGVWTARQMFLGLTGACADALAMTDGGDAFAARSGPLPAPVAAACARGLDHGATTAARTRGVEAVKAARQAGEIASFVSIPYLSALGDTETAFDHAYSYYFGKRDAATGRRRPLEPHAERWTDFLFASPAVRLRADPRFAALTEAIGLDAYWRATGTSPDYRAA